MAILKELQEQKIAESYSEQRNHWAFLAAVIVNSTRALGRFKRKPKLVEPDDFIGKELKQAVKNIFKQENRYDKHMEDAKAKGLRCPF